jgi:tRNA (guanine10-N2)-dimethyltransferase
VKVICLSPVPDFILFTQLIFIITPKFYPMKLIFELSGENPTLPFAELDCVATICSRRAQVAVAECPDPGAACRLAMTHAVLLYLGECQPETGSFGRLLKDLAIETDRPFAGRVKKVHSAAKSIAPYSSALEFERLIGTMIEGSVDLSAPETEYRAIISGDRCYFGRLLFTIDRGGFEKRNPGRRAFFHPGVMMPRMARALVNISCAQPGSRLLDPFCGTGGILIEAILLGIETIGIDFNPEMVRVSRLNTKESALLVADATRLPLEDESVDAVVTDLPYGQSVSIRKENSLEQLYDDTLSELRSVLKKGRRAVLVTHKDISGIAEQHMNVLQKHEQRVHKSLTRRILVLEKSV